MFKKLSFASFILILVVLVNIIGANAASTGNVKDYLNYLTEGEVNELQARIDSVKDLYSLDTVIVITNETNGKSSMDFADDFYDYNGYGVGSDHSGLLILINMQKREVWISTTGKAIGIFTDSIISSMVSDVKEPLSGGNYYSACNKFIDDVSSYSSSGVPGGEYSEGSSGTGQRNYNTSQGTRPYDNKTYFEKVHMLATSFPVYIVALIISLGATILISLSSKGKVTINTLTYEEDGTFELSGASDDFIRESTTKTQIESDSDSSGGSSTHTGSSGTSHGGGGGSF